MEFLKRAFELAAENPLVFYSLQGSGVFRTGTYQALSVQFIVYWSHFLNTSTRQGGDDYTK